MTRQIIGKLIKKVVKIALFAELFYVTASAIFVNTAVLSLINTDPQSILVEHSFAVSPLPGWVYLSGFRLRSQDRNIQFQILLDRAWVRIHLRHLFEREFHALSVRGSGLSFRLRFLRERDQVESIEYETLPAIEGLNEFVKRPPPPFVDPDKPWHVRIEKVNVSRLKELWFDTIRFAGVGAVKGGFSLWPGQRLYVDPSAVEIESGEIQLGKNHFASPVAASLHASVRKFYPEAEPGLLPFNFITMNLKMKAEITNLHFLNYYLGSVPWLTMHRGEGRLDADISLEDGVWRPGGYIHVSPKKLTATAWHQEIEGSGDVAWGVDDKETSLTVRFDQFNVKARDTHKKRLPGGIRGRGLMVRASTPQRRLTEPFSPMRVQWRIPRAEITDLRFCNGYLPKDLGLSLEGGTGELHSHLIVHTSSDGKDEGRVRLKTKKAKWRHQDQRFNGELSMDLRLNEGQFMGGEMDISGSELSFLSQADSPDEAWWGNVRASRGKLRVESPFELKAHVRVGAKDATPVTLGLLESAGPKWVRRLLSFDGLKASVDVDVGQKGLKLTSLVVRGEDTLLRGKYFEGDQLKQGRFLIEYGPLAAGLEIKRDDVRVRLHEAQAWFEGRARGVAE